MKLIKENAHIIIRLIITHIAMSIFGLVLFFATNMQKPATIMLAAGLFSAVFFCVISYTTMWEFGAKDKPAYDAGRRTGAAKFGFLVSLLGEAIWILLAIAYAIVNIFNIDVAALIYFIEFLTSACFTSVEVYIKNNLIADGSAITPYVVSGVYILGSLIVTVVNMFGYVLGTKDIKIFPSKKVTKK